MKTQISLLCVVVLAGSAQAQVATGFELPDVVASPAGTPLVAPWYNPVVPPGVIHDAYTYSGNALGLVTNPVGGNQFIGGTSGGGSAFPRAQLDINFSAGVWTLAYDMAAQWLGTGNSAINLSSFSLQHDTVPAGQFRQFIALNNFVDMANPSMGWKAEFNVFNAGGGALNNASPGAAWENLQVNRWYRQQITVDFTTNRVLSVALLDLHSLTVAHAVPADWYLTGGSASTLAMPNGVRFFIGGAQGNTMGWDNLYVIPAPGILPILGAGLAFGLRRRRA